MGGCCSCVWCTFSCLPPWLHVGGVWAVSVHTFVVESTGTTPTDVFGRIMILLSDFSGIEVVVYLVGIIQAIGLFLASRLGFRFSFYWVYLLPAIALLGLIGGGDILGNLPLQSTIPTVIVLLGLGPFVERRNSFFTIWT